MFKKKNTTAYAALPDEPAKTNYFLDKGFSDLGGTIRDSFKGNYETAQGCIERIRQADGLFKKFALGALNLAAAFAVCVFGSIITLVISVVHSLIILAIMICVLVVYNITRFIDMLYIRRGRISTVCDRCKTKSILPGYKCPKCGKVHYQLQPNVYGIFKHTCECGQKLPCAFFTKTSDENGKTLKRKELESVCANVDCSTAIFSRETRPITIPIAGGRSVGKTAFLTAVSHELIENVFPAKSCSIEMYSNEKDLMYKTVKTDFDSGNTSMTIESTDIQKPSAFSLSFFVKNSALKPDRLFHMFDIAGETFVHDAEHEPQQQYKNADGLVLIVDPFSFPDLRDQYESSLNEVDAKNIGPDDLNTVGSVFLAKVKSMNNLSPNQKAKIPVAIVLNKNDEAGVADYFTEENKNAYKAAHPEVMPDDLDSMFVQQFFFANLMGNFVNLFKANFENVKFFACSSIGHSKGEGAFTPKGVLEPVKWIVSFTDKQFAKAIFDIEGGKSGKQSDK